MQLSVIVATRNRAHAITGCLDSIAAAFAHAALLDAEIIVVDNGSTDGTAAVIKSWASACTVSVQLLYEPTAGLSRARNCALRAARGDLLAFTDDDCRLSKEYVIELLGHFSRDSGLVLRGGRIELGDPADLPLSINIAPKLMRWHRQENSARHQNLGDCLAGCNMTMRRTLAERLGPFDENLGAGTAIGASEDTDYICRAYLADATIEYVPDMAVFHYHGRRTIAAGKSLLRGYMTGNGALLTKYLLKDPNLIRPFYWDLKSAVREIVSGTNTFLPDIGFSYRDKVICSIRGAVKYFLICKHWGKISSLFIAKKQM